MMEAARTSETSVDNYFTWQYIPEDSSEHHLGSSPPPGIAHLRGGHLPKTKEGVCNKLVHSTAVGSRGKKGVYHLEIQS